MRGLPFAKETLAAHLDQHGFETELCPSSYDRLGLFFARRRAVVQARAS